MYVVYTGDIVNSSKLSETKRLKLLEVMHRISDLFKLDDLPPLKINRGDSFQAIDLDLSKAIEKSIAMRAFVKMQIDKPVDARIAIGIGEVNLLLPEIGESDGEAFKNSGQLLDTKSNHYLLFRSPWKALNDEMEIHCNMLDLLIKGWTKQQSEVIWERLQGLNQTTIAQKIGISQASVNKRLQLAHWDELQMIINRYKTLINSYTEND